MFYIIDNKNNMMLFFLSYDRFFDIFLVFFIFFRHILISISSIFSLYFSFFLRKRSWYLNINLTLSSYLFKTNFKIDKTFNAKGIQNNGIWNHTAKEYWENKPYFNFPYFTFRLPFTTVISLQKLFALLGNIIKFPRRFFKSSSHI